MNTIGLFLIGFFTCLLLSALIWRFRGEASFADKGLPACLPLLAYLAVATVIVNAVTGDPSFYAWDAARLTPSAALFKGLQIYSTTEHGSVQTSLYPPAWIFSYSPVLLARSPTAVLVIGYVLTQVFTMVPVLVLCFMVSADKRVALIAFSAFVFASTQIPALSMACFRPHSDSPSLGFGLSACILMMVDRKSGWAKQLFPILSLTAGWLAVGSKQVMLPIIPTLLLWVLFVRGSRAFFVFSGWAVVIGILVAAALVAPFSLEGLILNVITFHVQCPWLGEFPYNIGRVFNELLQSCWVPVIFLLAGFIFAWSTREESGILSWLKGKSWALLMVAAVFHFPTSTLGRMKAGGNINTLSPTLYFLVVAVCVLLIDIHDMLSSRQPRPAALSYYQLFLVFSSFFIVGCWCFPLLQQMGDGELYLGKNPSQRAFEYLNKTNGDAYFPSQPLSHLMAEGVLYHFSSAIFDREEVVGIPVSSEQKELHFPKGRNLVCWEPGTSGTAYVRSQYFREYDVEVKVEGLCGFECFRTDHRGAVEAGFPEP